MLFYMVVCRNHTHFSILNKEYIERDEYTEVEDIDVVLHSHLCTSKQTNKKSSLRFSKQCLNTCTCQDCSMWLKCAVV